MSGAAVAGVQTHTSSRAHRHSLATNGEVDRVAHGDARSSRVMHGPWPGRRQAGGLGRRGAGRRTDREPCAQILGPKSKGQWGGAPWGGDSNRARLMCFRAARRRGGGQRTIADDDAGGPDNREEGRHGGERSNG
jgi:hypothetical protein